MGMSRFCSPCGVHVERERERRGGGGREEAQKFNDTMYNVAASLVRDKHIPYLIQYYVWFQL